MCWKWNVLSLDAKGLCPASCLWRLERGFSRLTKQGFRFEAKTERPVGRLFASVAFDQEVMFQELGFQRGAELLKGFVFCEAAAGDDVKGFDAGIADLLVMSQFANRGRLFGALFGSQLDGAYNPFADANFSAEQEGFRLGEGNHIAVLDFCGRE